MSQIRLCFGRKVNGGWTGSALISCRNNKTTTHIIIIISDRSSGPIQQIYYRHQYGKVITENLYPFGTLLEFKLESKEITPPFPRIKQHNNTIIQHHEETNCLSKAE